MHRREAPPEGQWNGWITLALVAIVVASSVSIWLLFHSSGSPRPSASPSVAAGRATRHEAVLLARAFAHARVDRTPVDRFITGRLQERYQTNAGGLYLYDYTWANHPPTDITGFDVFHVEVLGQGSYLVALNLHIAGPAQAVREEDLILGPGTNAAGRAVRLVVQRAQLPGA